MWVLDRYGPGLIPIVGTVCDLAQGHGQMDGKWQRKKEVWQRKKEVW